MSVFEQLEILLNDIKIAKEDIVGTDYENLDKDQLKKLSIVAFNLSKLCDSTVKQMNDLEID
ncbi:hypothetical protein [Clostridium paraputrificum]|uniref:hypothetical protein n=1 Tax=Clostridium paraputrificum TaxID=29363 RepID=UPI00189EDF54|nr:hypothetical protein [Clostridium paraputrificum]